MIQGPVRRFGWMLVLTGWLLGLAAACPAKKPKPEPTPEPPPITNPEPVPPVEPPVGTKTLDELGSAEFLRNVATRDAALALLDAALKAEDPGDRYLATEALWILPWEEALPRLEAATKDSDPQVAMVALVTLAERGGPDVMPILRGFMNWEDLHTTIPNYHPEFLRPQLSFEVVHSPIEALAQAKDPIVRPYIVDHLRSTNLRDALYGSRLAEWYGIAEFQTEASDLWNAAPSDALRIQLSRAFYAAGINREQNAATLREGFSPVDFGTSLMLFNACLLYEWTEFAPEIRKVMKGAQDPILRSTALETLGLLDQEITLDQQKTVLADDDGRGNILPRIAEWGDQTTQKCLAEQKDPSKTDYAFILLALAQFGDNAALDELIALSQEKDAAGMYTKRAGAAFNALMDTPQDATLAFMRAALLERKVSAQRHYAALQGLARRLSPDTLPDAVLYAQNFSEAYPGLAAWAAAIAVQLTTEKGAPSLPGSDRLLWPLPQYGRYKPAAPAPAEGGE